MDDRKTHKKVVFVSGNFFTVHPGHVRLLKFAAECGQTLVVGINDFSPDASFPTPQERAEALMELGIVDRAVVLENGIEHVLRELRPDVVVKGKEWEAQTNAEESIVQSYGGQVLFSSGEPAYSGSELLLRDAAHARRARLMFPKDFAERHACAPATLRPLVDGFAKLKVVVVGDFIADEYIDCAALGLSREDATLVVSPRSTERFIGGAGIVAAHAHAMGADVTFVSVAGCDELGDYARDELGKLGVHVSMIDDESRPTTLKQRFRSGGKTLLRVSHLRQHAITRELKSLFVERALAALTGADLLIFSDFNYGVLPQPVVDELTAAARAAGILIVADSQSSSQFGDISRFTGAALLAPTEHEARLALRDQTGGIAVIGNGLLERTGSTNAFVTLGAEGMVIFTHPQNGPAETDRLPAFNPNPVDVAGAGDATLVAGALTLAAGGTPWQAGFLGSVAAGIQTGRIGNVPVKAAEILQALL